jgi:hypothetical protein
MSRPFQVFVNGVEQAEAADFEVVGAWIVFARELVPPREESAGSVFRGFFFGRYRTEHVVDVACARRCACPATTTSRGSRRW